MNDNLLILRSFAESLDSAEDSNFKSAVLEGIDALIEHSNEASESLEEGTE
jgi:hypothetical protein